MSENCVSSAFRGVLAACSVASIISMPFFVQSSLNSFDNANALKASASISERSEANTNLAANLAGLFGSVGLAGACLAGAGRRSPNATTSANRPPAAG